MKVTKPVGLRLLALLAVFAMVVAACTGTTTDETTTTSGDDGDGATTTTGGGDGVGDGAVDGPTFRVGFIANVTTDNWWAAQDTENSSYNQYLDATKVALFDVSLPGFVYHPQAADTDAPAEPVQEGDLWVVEQTMRQDLTWSDGEPVTTHDLAFYFDVVREFNLGTGHALTFPPEVESVTAVDDYTVRVEFNVEPGLVLWNNGVGFAEFVPEHFWAPHVEEARAAAEEFTSSITSEDAAQAIVDAAAETEDTEDDVALEDVTQEMIDEYIASAGANEGLKTLYAVQAAQEPSVGAQIFSEWQTGAFAATVSNPGYPSRGDENTLYSDGSFRIVTAGGEDNVYGGEGSGDVIAQYVEGPFVSEILWVEHSSKDAAYEKLSAGEIDYVWDPTGLTTGLRNELANNPDLSFSVNESDGFRYMAFNLRKAPMSDLAFRRAVATIVNKELIADTVLAGGVFPAYSIISESQVTFYNPDINRPGWGEGAPMSEADRFVTAIQILKDAGYTWQSEPVIDVENPDPVVTPGSGLTMPDGTPVPELTLLAPGPGYDPFRATFAVWIESWLTDLGVPARAEPTDFNAIVDAVFTPENALEWDMYMLGWGGGDLSLPQGFVQFFAAENDSTLGGSNTPGYNSPEFEQMVAEFRGAKDIEAAGEIIKQMEALIAEDLPYVVLFRTPIIEAFRSNVQFPVQSIVGGHNSQPDAWPNAVQVTAAQ